MNCYRKETLDADKAQLNKFKELAHELEADEDEARWDERLKKVLKAKLEEKKPSDRGE